MTKAIQPPAWTGQALCAQVDPAIFFPPKNGSAAEPGLSVAAVIAECLQWAMDTKEQHGIYGGLTAKERAKLRQAAA